MQPKQTRPRTKAQTITTIILTSLLLFIIGSYIYYMMFAWEDVAASTVRIEVMDNPILSQFVVLPLLAIFCGTSLVMLLRRRQLTPPAIIVIVALSLFVAGCLIHRAVQATAPCYYDPSNGIQTDFLSHRICPNANTAMQLYGFIFSPLVTTVADVALLLGIGSLILQLIGKWQEQLIK